MGQHMCRGAWVLVPEGPRLPQGPMIVSLVRSLAPRSGGGGGGQPPAGLATVAGAGGRKQPALEAPAQTGTAGPAEVHACRCAPRAQQRRTAEGWGVEGCPPPPPPHGTSSGWSRGMGPSPPPPPPSSMFCSLTWAAGPPRPLPPPEGVGGQGGGGVEHGGHGWI